MSQLPPNESQSGSQPGQAPSRAFWISGVGGFVLGALAVIIVLLLARRLGSRDEVRSETRPAQNAAQSDAASGAERLK